MAYMGSRLEYHEKLESKEIWNELHNCPFCNILNNPDQIIWEGHSWYIVYNIFPYTGNSQHIMAIPKLHFTIASEITSDVWLELWEVQKVVTGLFAGNEYFSFTRETFSWRSIDHYHTHFLPGTLYWKFLIHMLEKQGFPVQHEPISTND